MAPGGPDADLQVVWALATDTLVHPVAGRIGPVPYRRTGGHSPRGFAFVAGPGIEAGDLGTRSVLDVTATVAEFLGRAPATAVEGTPLVHDPGRGDRPLAELMAPARLSVVVCTCDRAPLLQGCLEQLARPPPPKGAGSR